RCPACGSPRLIRHGEIDALAIAHVDCDAFYATIEKRDNPALAEEPVIVGGGRRGVVLTACYIARTYGVRSAMPMFEARRLCPQASIVPPDMEKYARVGREVRSCMRELTPLVKPVSLIFGVGKVAQARLAGEGLRTIGDIQRAGEGELMRRQGKEGARLYRLACGVDDRPVCAERASKSVSAETTFDHDIAELRPLELQLWRLTEKVSARLKQSELAGATVTLKLK